MKKIIVIIGLIGTIAGIYFPVANSRDWWPFSPLEVQLEIVKAYVDDTSRPPTLDITVLNNGDKTAVLTGVNVCVINFWTLKPNEWLLSLLPPTEYVDCFELKTIKDYTDLYKISHVVSPNVADRFSFEIKSDQPEGVEIVYQIKVEIVSGNKKFELERPLLFVVKDLSRRGIYSPVSISNETKIAAQEIQDEEGLKSEYLENIIPRILTNP